MSSSTYSPIYCTRNLRDIYDWYVHGDEFEKYVDYKFRTNFGGGTKSVYKVREMHCVRFKRRCQAAPFKSLNCHFGSCSAEETKLRDLCKEVSMAAFDNIKNLARKQGDYNKLAHDSFEDLVDTMFEFKDQFSNWKSSWTSWTHDEMNTRKHSTLFTMCVFFKYARKADLYTPDPRDKYLFEIWERLSTSKLRGVYLPKEFSRDRIEFQYGTEESSPFDSKDSFRHVLQDQRGGTMEGEPEVLDYPYTFYIGCHKNLEYDDGMPTNKRSFEDFTSRFCDKLKSDIFHRDYGSAMISECAHGINMIIERGIDEVRPNALNGGGCEPTSHEVSKPKEDIDEINKEMLGILNLSVGGKWVFDDESSIHSDANVIPDAMSDQITVNSASEPHTDYFDGGTDVIGSTVPVMRPSEVSTQNPVRGSSLDLSVLERKIDDLESARKADREMLDARHAETTSNILKLTKAILESNLSENYKHDELMISICDFSDRTDTDMQNLSYGSTFWQGQISTEIKKIKTSLKACEDRLYDRDGFITKEIIEPRDVVTTNIEDLTTSAQSIRTQVVMNSETQRQTELRSEARSTASSIEVSMLHMSNILDNFTYGDDEFLMGDLTFLAWCKKNYHVTPWVYRVTVTVICSFLGYCHGSMGVASTVFKAMQMIMLRIMSEYKLSLERGSNLEPEPNVVEFTKGMETLADDKKGGSISMDNVSTVTTDLARKSLEIQQGEGLGDDLQLLDNIVDDERLNRAYETIIGASSNSGSQMMGQTEGLSGLGGIPYLESE